MVLSIASEPLEIPMSENSSAFQLAKFHVILKPAREMLAEGVEGRGQNDLQFKNPTSLHTARMRRRAGGAAAIYNESKTSPWNLSSGQKVIPATFSRSLCRYIPVLTQGPRDDCDAAA